MAWAEQLDLGSPILGEAKTTLQLGREPRKATRKS